MILGYIHQVGVDAGDVVADAPHLQVGIGVKAAQNLLRVETQIIDELTIEIVLLFAAGTIVPVP